MLEQVKTLTRSPQQLNHLLKVPAGRVFPLKKQKHCHFKVFNKYPGDFDNVCKSKQEFLDSVSQIIIYSGQSVTWVVSLYDGF